MTYVFESLYKPINESNETDEKSTWNSQIKMMDTILFKDCF